jgi:hypothetical protein
VGDVEEDAVLVRLDEVGEADLADELGARRVVVDERGDAERACLAEVAVSPKSPIRGGR